MKPYGFERKPRLYVPLQQRFDRGVYPVLEHIEQYADEATFEAVIACMNAAFDAGQVEMLEKQAKK